MSIFEFYFKIALTNFFVFKKFDDEIIFTNVNWHFNSIYLVTYNSSTLVMNVATIDLISNTDKQLAQFENVTEEIKNLDLLAYRSAGYFYLQGLGQYLKLYCNQVFLLI
jgi:hypothetical protein